MKKISSRKFIIPAVACLAVIIFLCYYYFFTAMTNGGGSRFVYIDEDDNIDSVYAQLDTMSSRHALAGFKTLVRHSSYEDNIRTGRYEIEEGNSAFTVFRKLKNGLQSSVRLTIPSVRTADKLAGALSKKLMADGYIGGGMLPKLQNCIDAIENGVSRVHILDGRIPHCLLLEIFTNKGIGTAILNSDESRYYHGE